MNYFKFAALMGASSVALGAFGAHGLSVKLQSLGITDGIRQMNNWKTASYYQMIHSVLLMGLSQREDVKGYTKGMIGSGSIMFSGSIYLLVIGNLKGWNIGRIVGPMTPLGGMLMIFGWMSLLID